MVRHVNGANRNGVRRAARAYDALGSFALAPLGIVAAGVAVEALGTQITAWIAVAMVVIPTALTLLVTRDVVRQMRLDSD